MKERFDWKSPAGEENAPAFNSAMAYLQRVSDLMSAIHIEMLEHNYESAFDNLNQLYIELYPRMQTHDGAKGMIDDAHKLKIKCIEAMNKNYEENQLFPKNDNDNHITKYEYLTGLALQKYQMHLNVAAHKLGLVMVDKEISQRATRLI